MDEHNQAHEPVSASATPRGHASATYVFQDQKPTTPGIINNASEPVTPDSEREIDRTHAATPFPLHRLSTPCLRGCCSCSSALPADVSLDSQDTPQLSPTSASTAHVDQTQDISSSRDSYWPYSPTPWRHVLGPDDDLADTWVGEYSWERRSPVFEYSELRRASPSPPTLSAYMYGDSMFPVDACGDFLPGRFPTPPGSPQRKLSG